MHAFEASGGRTVVALERLALDPVEINLHPIGDAAVNERFNQRFIRIF